MSNEQTPESFESTPMEGGEGASPAPGRSFRRRRRRNKNRGPAGQNAGSVQAAGSEDGNAAQQASTEGAPAPQSQNGQPRQNQGGGQNQQGFGGRRKRRKKFFQDRQGGGGQQAPVGNRADRPQGQNFGGSNGNFGNGGGGRRKQKQRGARSFVGPMDHSYRESNGNYADSPPSTISVNGNQGGGHRRNNNAHMHDTGHQAQFLGRVYEPPAPVIAEDAPVRIFCFIDDLFFTAKINESARKLGVKVAFVKAEKEDIARITDAPEGQRASLVIFDLNNANAKPMTVIPKLRTKLKRTVSIVGFLNHLQGDLKAKAIEAGCDTVMPRSAFSQNLPNMLRRYGLEEDTSELADAQHAYF